MITSDSGAWRLALLLAGAILTGLAGCNGDDPATTNAPTTGAAANGSAGSAESSPQAENQCAVIIGSVQDTYTLQRLDQTTTTAAAVARLNDWLRECAPASKGPAELPETIVKLLTESQRSVGNEARFVLRDGEHLQNCTMFRAVARYALAPAADDPSELARVVRGFLHVIRSVELVPRHPQDLPLSPYEIVLLGKGTAADRAWVFACLLRQAHLDAVLLTPSAADPDAANAATPFLVGVPLEGGVYLFDPRLGIPIPAAARGGDGTGPGVATLAEAASDPTVFDQLQAGADYRYPIRSTDLKSLSVSLISDAAFWSERMRVLQQEFTGAQGMVISDPLGDSAAGPGLWSRLGKAGGEHWSPESLRVWSYPETQLAAHVSPTEDQLQSRSVVFAPFRAFLNAVQDQNGQVRLVEEERWKDPAVGEHDINKNRQNVRTTTNSHMRARLAHLDGDFARAVQGYREVSQRAKVIAGLDGVRPAVAIPHVRAMDDATYWMALCKFDEGEYRVAVDTCRRYLKQHSGQSQPGVWTRQCRYLLALSLAAQADYSAARDALLEVEPDDPEYGGYQWLIRYWSEEG